MRLGNLIAVVCSLLTPALAIAASERYVRAKPRVVVEEPEAPQTSTMAYYENSVDGGEDKLLISHTLSFGWISESIYPEGLIGGAPGEGVGWIEYEITWKGDWYTTLFGAMSDSNPGTSDSVATVLGVTVGHRNEWAGEHLTTTLEKRLMYFDSGLPSLGDSEGDVWGIGLRASFGHETSGLTPYIDLANYWEVEGDGAGDGFVARAGVEGDWLAAEQAGWAIDVALGHNFGWYGLDMTYAYVYVGPYFIFGKWTFSIPEVTVILELDGNGESHVSGSFTFERSWGGE